MADEAFKSSPLYLEEKEKQLKTLEAALARASTTHANAMAKYEKLTKAKDAAIKEPRRRPPRTP